MSESAIARVEDFEEQPAQAGGMIQVAQSRAAQEVQAAMVVAQRCPRDQSKSFVRIMNACKRKSLAEKATYKYPKGGTSVEGPSIRLAEVLMREWGNMDAGVIELEQRDGESTMMAYAWDLETNTRSTRIFSVKHLRYTKKGSYTLTDPREIYEIAANTGARRMRACILALIPGDVTEAALEECDKTLTTGNTEPLVDRARKMLIAFAELSVSQQMIEKRLGHKIDAISERQMVDLRKVYASIRDGFAGADEFFPPDEPANAPMNLRDQARGDNKSPPTKPGAAAPTNAPGSESNGASGSVKAPAGSTLPSQAPSNKAADAHAGHHDGGGTGTTKDAARPSAAQFSPPESVNTDGPTDGAGSQTKGAAADTGPAASSAEEAMMNQADAFATETAVPDLRNWLMSLSPKARHAAREKAKVDNLLEASDQQVREVAYNAKLAELQRAK